MKYLNTIKFAAKVLAFTQISEYVYAVDSNLNDKYEIIDDMLFKKADKRTKRAAHSSGQFWKEGNVYYTFSAETPFDDEYKQTIKEAMNDLSNIANIKFIEESNDDIKNRENYITIFKNNTLDCAASVGPTGKYGGVTLDPNRCKKDSILHEFMHTLGFQHEHQRFDQSEYVTIIKENIKDYNGKFVASYGKDYYRNAIISLNSKNSLTDVGIGYDVDSIMHYDSYHFSLDPEGMPIEQYTRPTILRKDGINGGIIPDPEVLSSGDKLALRRIYGSVPSKVVMDRDGNRVQYCKPYKLEYKILPEQLGSWNYVISSADSESMIMNRVYDKSAVVIFEPKDDPTLCSEKVERLDKRIKLDVEKTDEVKIKFQNENKYLESNNSQYFYLNSNQQDNITEYCKPYVISFVDRGDQRSKSTDGGYAGISLKLEKWGSRHFEYLKKAYYVGLMHQTVTFEPYDSECNSSIARKIKATDSVKIIFNEGNNFRDKSNEYKNYKYLSTWNNWYYLDVRSWSKNFKLNEFRNSISCNDDWCSDSNNNNYTVFWSRYGSVANN